MIDVRFVDRATSNRTSTHTFVECGFLTLTCLTSPRLSNLLNFTQHDVLDKEGRTSSDKRVVLKRRRQFEQLISAKTRRKGRKENLYYKH